MVALALAVRLLWFTGLSLGDDTAYVAQVIAHSCAGRWPPDATHWSTRLGVTMPTVLAVWALGLRPIAFVLWPLTASLLRVLVCWRVARSFVDARAASWAALLQASFPLEIIYSTHLFPDVIVGLFSSLALWCWIRALGEDRSVWPLAAGGALAAGYLCRETVLMDGPIYLALWLAVGRPRRPRLAWVAAAPLAVFLLECALYGATAGTPSYRWAAIRAQQADPDNIALMRQATAGGGFWTDPILMALTSHELGPGFAAALPIAAYVLLKKGGTALRLLAIWLVVGFVWMAYGTASLRGWQPLQRDPRYLAGLTTPCVILLAWAGAAAGRRRGGVVLALLAAGGVAAAGLDSGNRALGPHRALLALPALEGAVLEPAEYLGARWALGLARGPDFDCAADIGRERIARQLADLPGARLRPVEGAHTFIFSPDRRPDLLRRMTARGWTEAAAIPAPVNPVRAAVGRLLALVPSQRGRADRILHPEGLRVLSRRPPGPG